MGEKEKGVTSFGELATPCLFCVVPVVGPVEASDGFWSGRSCYRRRVYCVATGLLVNGKLVDWRNIQNGWGDSFMMRFHVGFFCNSRGCACLVLVQRHCCKTPHCCLSLVWFESTTLRSQLDTRCPFFGGFDFALIALGAKRGSVRAEFLWM